MTLPDEAVAGRPGRRRRSGARTGATGALAAAWLALSLLVAPTAGAGTGSLSAPSERCSAGWVCGWTDPGYTGVVSLVSQDMARYPETTAYVGFNGGASVWNSTKRCVTVYSGAGYRGKSLTVRPDQGVSRLPASFDGVRSNRFHSCRPS
ncbi:peptidase inhibitor family I36 protein [Streptomyces sp. NPDC006512]|uniref:peptidase inhibitor family I36 protein n=1 Tax=Streptomyces sp. NPDC006512 TaxID=3154307 RepID=UPI0033BB9CFE